MLHTFLTTNRSELINRCKQKVSRRSVAHSPEQSEHGIPIFLDQLLQTLYSEETSNPVESLKVSGGPNGGRTATSSQIGITAGKHGQELHEQGFSVGQVVHNYGDLCQAVTELAVEQHTPISAGEFRTLNRCLDNAIAGAVTAYVVGWNPGAPEANAQSLDKQLASLGDQMRNLLDSVDLTLDVIKQGTVGFGGATGAVLNDNVASMRHLLDRSLAQMRLQAGHPVARERISVEEFIQHFEVIATSEAKSKSIEFTVNPVEQNLVIDADRQLLYGAVSNLLENAFKFTRPNGQVSLTVYATPDRVLIDVKDECGGLPPGQAAQLVRDFQQPAVDHAGSSHGLSITYRSVAANGGKLQVRDLPGSGCVFTIDMPRQPLTPTK